MSNIIKALFLQQSLEELLQSRPPLAGLDRFSQHTTACRVPPVFTSADIKGQATARGIKATASPAFYFFLYILSFRLLLPRQESLSHLNAAELRVRTQHRAHRSLISQTSDHSSRSARQNSLKNCISKKSFKSPQCFF